MTTPKPARGTDAADGTKGLRADARRNRARILKAAEEVFAEKGPSAATEEVAARAGLAIGTLFKHFPTKQDLLRAIMKDLLERLTQEVETLADEEDPATALFTFVSRTVEQAARKKTVVGLLAESGADLRVGDSVGVLGRGIEGLLTRSQQAGAVREDVRLDEVLALLTATCQGALNSGWNPDLQRRTLAIVFDGLRPPGSPRL